MKASTWKAVGAVCGHRTCRHCTIDHHMSGIIPRDMLLFVGPTVDEAFFPALLGTVLMFWDEIIGYEDIAGYPMPMALLPRKGK